MMNIQGFGEITKTVGDVIKALGEIMAAYPVIASIMCTLGIKQLCVK